MRAKKYDNGGKTKKKKGGGTEKKLPFIRTAQSDTLERSEEQAMENARTQYPGYRPEKTYEEKLEEARLRRERNARTNASNARRAKQSGRDYYNPSNSSPKPLDETNLRNKDGSPLRGGPKKTPIAPKEIPTKTPKKTLNKSKAVIPVPTKKEVRQGKRKNRK